jgi:hypothetical protein
MKKRMDLAAAKGCDGVEPDNMDAFNQDSCFSISSDEQLAYNQAIANYARSIKLSVALKNDPDQVTQLVDYFDFSVSEECFQFKECDSYSPFINDDKPVFNAEYIKKYKEGPDLDSLCQRSKLLHIQSLVLPLSLNDSFRISCL